MPNMIVLMRDAMSNQLAWVMLRLIEFPDQDLYEEEQLGTCVPKADIKDSEM